MGLAIRIKVLRKQNMMPPSRMKDNSRPEAFTIGVSLNLMKIKTTNEVKTMPVTETVIAMIEYIESHFM